MSGFNGTPPPPVDDDKTQRWFEHLSDRIERIGGMLCPPGESDLYYPQRVARLETHVKLMALGLGAQCIATLGWIFS